MSTKIIFGCVGILIGVLTAVTAVTLVQGSLIPGAMAALGTMHAVGGVPTILQMCKLCP